MRGVSNRTYASQFSHIFQIEYGVKFTPVDLISSSIPRIFRVTSAALPVAEMV